MIAHGRDGPSSANSTSADDLTRLAQTWDQWGMVPAGSGAIPVLDFFVKWAVVLHGRDDTVE